jgi:hypothetical protein
LPKWFRQEFLSEKELVDLQLHQDRGIQGAQRLQQWFSETPVHPL